MRSKCLRKKYLRKNESVAYTNPQYIRIEHKLALHLRENKFEVYEQK